MTNRTLRRLFHDCTSFRGRSRRTPIVPLQRGRRGRRDYCHHIPKVAIRFSDGVQQQLVRRKKRLNLSEWTLQIGRLLLSNMRPIDKLRRACFISCAALAWCASPTQPTVASTQNGAHAPCRHPDSAPSCPYRTCTDARARRRREGAGPAPGMSGRESANAVVSGRRIGLLMRHSAAMRV
jgi:hypothetical protein